MNTIGTTHRALAPVRLTLKERQNVECAKSHNMHNNLKQITRDVGAAVRKKKRKKKTKKEYFQQKFEQGTEKRLVSSIIASIVPSIKLPKLRRKVIIDAS